MSQQPKTTKRVETPVDLIIKTRTYFPYERTDAGVARRVYEEFLRLKKMESDARK